MPTTERTARAHAAISLSVLAVAATLVPLPILLHEGWPYNTEFIATFQRVEAFRRAFAAGDWYPVWTKFAHTGYGSPYPLFYHRLFSTAGGALALITGADAAVRLLTSLLLLAGGAGMRRLLRVSGVGEPLACVAGLLFIVAPYTRTDWLVRGAMAEFTALAVLPWVYAELSLLTQGRSRWVPLAVGMVLLFHAHSIIFLFFALSAAVPAIVRLVRQGRSEVPSILGAAAILLAGVVAPVIVSSALVPWFNLDVMTQTEGLRLENNYRPLFRLLVDGWRLDADGISLEINRYLLVGLALLLPFGLRHRTPLRLYFVLWSLVCLALQLPLFLPLIEAIPKGRFLQFPYRLLSFVVLGAIFLLIVSAQAWVEAGGRRARLATLVTGAVLLASVLHFGIIRPGAHKYIDADFLRDQLTNLDGPRSGGEYQLAGSGTKVFVGSQQQFVAAPDCEDRIREVERLEQGAFRLEAELSSRCRVSIRQFQTPMLELTVENGTILTPTPSKRIIVELEPGHSSVVLRPRSFLALLFRTLTHRLEE